MRQLLLILLCIVLILLVLRLFTVNRKKYKEGFYQEKHKQIPPDVEKLYKQFIDFYNPFIQQWGQSIQTAIASNTTQQPLTSPSQVQQINPSQKISKKETTELNEYITQLSATQNENLPQIPDYTFPSSLKSLSPQKLQEVADNLPTDAQPYINALNWVNSNLGKAHGNLQSALQGNFNPSTSEPFTNIEGFFQISQQCQQFQECEKEQQEGIVNTIQNNLQQFFMNNTVLQQTWEQNKTLVAKSNDIQNKAQNGDLYKQVSIKDTAYYAPIQIPPGSDNLKNLQQNDPDKYNNYKQNYSQWFQIKSLIDQINSNL